MRAQWKQKGQKPGVYALFTGKGDSRKEIAKVEKVTHKFPAPGAEILAAVSKDKFSVVDAATGNKVEYVGSEATVARYLRAQLGLVQLDHKDSVDKGKELTAKGVSADLDKHDPFAPRTRRTHAETIQDLAAQAGIADSEDVRKLLAILAEKAKA